MALRKKTGGRNFTPGNQHGKGRPTLPEHLKKANLESQSSKRTLQYLLGLSHEQLLAFAAKPDATVFELMWAKQLIDAIEKGDTAKLNLALERSEGKVPNVNQNEDITGRDKDLEQIPREALIELVKKA